MTNAAHKKYLKVIKKKTVILLADSDSESESEVEFKPKKKRLTNYNKFMKSAMPQVRAKYPGEKTGYYMSVVGAMWKALSKQEQEAFAKKKRL